MTTLAQYTKQFVHFLRKNKAVSALEYAILVGAIAIAVASAAMLLGDNVETAMKQIGNKVEAAGRNMKAVGQIK